MEDLKQIQEFFSKPLEESPINKFADYSNNELAAYARELSKQRADAASKGQSDLLGGINKEIEAATRELKKRSQALKGLTRTDIEEDMSLLRGASKETRARDTEESDREYIKTRQERNKIAQQLYKKDYKDLDLHQKSRVNSKRTPTESIKEQADHVAPMVVKAYKEYLEAKKEGDGEKAYRYYSKKLNNTYSTRADRDAIEAILKKKYGSALEEASKEEMDKFAKFQKDLQKTMSTQGWKDLEDRAKEERKERETRKSKPVKEIKGFEEFKETGFKLGDKVKFMGSAHPTHTKPIKLTGTIEYFEPADEIGIRVDGYGAFIPFFKVQSNIESINEGVSFEQIKKAVTHHKDGNPYYDKTKLINLYNQLSSSDQAKAKKEYSEYFGISESINEGGIEDIQKQLDALGVKYEMSKTDKVRPFKVIYKPINKSDEFYDKFEDIVDLANLKGVVKTSMNEGAEEIMDAYNDVLDLVKKHSRNLSDDDSYAFGLKLKAWFEKNILDEYNTGIYYNPTREKNVEKTKEASKVGIEKVKDMIKKIMKEDMSLDDQTKAYFLAKVKNGEIDTLPENPKAAFLAQKFKDLSRTDKSVKENEGEDAIDTITMDVPLFIRLLEYAREDAENDMDLHDVAEKAIAGTKQQGILSMDDYDMLVGDLEQIAMNEEEGYSPFLKDDPEHPEGKTQGLDTKTMNKILMKVIQDLDESRPGLWDNIRAKKERGEKPSHPNSKAYKSAVKAGKEINKAKK